MKKLLLLLLLSLGLTATSSAGYLDDWSDDAICSWMEQASPPEHIVDEAIKRNLDCIPESIASKLQEEISPTIMIYDADFSQSALDNLLSTDVEKTDFDFSKYELVKNDRNINCKFVIKEVLYENSVEGDIKPWNIAEGHLEIDSGKVNIIRGSRWDRGGLSADPSYLRDEVNLRLTEDGYLVGKMAFFLWSGKGEAPKKPLYVELIKHKKSKPLSHRRTALWIDVNDWSDAILYLSNCSIYKRNYKDGKLDGKSTTWYENDQIKSKENYKDGKLDGKRTTWYKDGQIESEVNYKNNKKEGKETTWYENGQIKSESTHNKLEGKKTSWYQSGKIKSEVNYKNNKKEGKETTWYENGRVKSENNYKNGYKEGKFSVWYDNGQIKSENNYTFDDIDGIQTSWDENGQKKSEVIYSKKEYKKTSWYDNGQKEAEENRKDRKLDGKRTTWYKNGQIKSENNFKNGKKEGKSTTWHEDGQIKSENNFKNGMLIVTE